MMLLGTLAVPAIKAVTAILAPLNGHTVCIFLNQPLVLPANRHHLFGGEIERI